MAGEAGPQFLDTNVLVYAFDRSAGSKHERAVDLLEELMLDGTGTLSVQVLQELFVTLTAKLPSAVPPAEANELVADLATMRTHAPDAEDVLAAVDVHRRLRISFWDAMIVRSASALGCGILWTEDLGDGRRYDDVQVRNPFAEDLPEGAGSR